MNYHVNKLVSAWGVNRGGSLGSRVGTRSRGGRGGELDLGKLPGALDVAADIGGAVASQGFIALPVTIPHTQRAGGLPGPHKDPFDRMLIAQSQLEDLPLVSIEEVFDGYGVNRMWG